MPLGAILWLGVGVIAAVLEGITTQLISIWFAIGAAVTAIAALLGASTQAQMVIFVVVSALLLVGTRPLIKKKLQVEKQPTNADQLIGQIAVVTDPTDLTHSVGRVMAAGLDWSAKTQAGTLMKTGDRVVILAIEGVTLIVRPHTPEKEEEI